MECTLRYSKILTKNKSKLGCVKLIKEITGLGLKESKWIADEVDDKGESSFNIIPEDTPYTVHYLHTQFQDFGYEFSYTSRDYTISKVLSKFNVNNIVEKEWEICVEDGDYSIKDNLFTINVIKGTLFKSKISMEEIENKTFEFSGTGFYVTKES